MWGWSNLTKNQKVLLVVLALLLFEIRYSIFNDTIRDPLSFRRRAFFTPKYADNFVKNRNPDKPFRILKKYNTRKTTNILSYSLYGENDIYFAPLLKSIKKVRDRLPDWSVRVHIHDKAKKSWFDRLNAMKVDLVVVEDEVAKPGNSSGMFWRYLPFHENRNVVVLDTDDVLNDETIKAINSFFTSSTKLIRTRWSWPYPQGYMWGGLIMKKKNLTTPYSEECLLTYPVRKPFGADEIFLANCLIPHLKEEQWEKEFYHMWFAEFIVKFAHDYIVRDRVPTQQLCPCN